MKTSIDWAFTCISYIRVDDLVENMIAIYYTQGLNCSALYKLQVPTAPGGEPQSSHSDTHGRTNSSSISQLHV